MGLAIDGGNLFMQRRRAQNAADAAAMAGTRMLAKAINTCHADPDGTDAVIASQVNRFAEQNGVSDTNGVPGDEVNANVTAHYLDADSNVLGQVGGGTVPAGATGIEASVQQDHQTYFLALVGIDQAGASAGATAMTGAITQFSGGGGLLPFAVHVDVVDGLGMDETFRALDITNQHTGGEFCTDTNGNGRYDDGVDICIGDASPANAHRGWLNLNYIYNKVHLDSYDPLNRTFEQNVPNRGCGSNPDHSIDDGLQGWASRGECPYPFPVIAGTVDDTNGDFIHGSPGSRTSSVQAIEDTFVGYVGYAPLFDYIYTSDYMDEHFEDPEEPGSDHDDWGWPRAGGGGSAFLYHVVGFVAIEVQDMGSHSGQHHLDGAFKGAIIGDGVFQPGTGFDPTVCQPAMVYGVSLWN
jgi:hypothetical protein